MDTITPLSPSTLSPVELEQLRVALSARYPDSKGVLGSQLGAVIRKQLINPDLKGRFGGLKRFVARYFPAEITWRERNGLDDLYDISFAGAAVDSGGDGIWQPVSPEPSAAFWSAVTNPSIAVQFGWSISDRSLLRASAGVPLTEGASLVEKLTQSDYQEIAISFVNSLENFDAGKRAQAIESSRSNVEFTRLIREQGLLAKWEEFRVDQALRLFIDRLRNLGAEPSAISQWADVLRRSQQLARLQRSQKTASIATRQPSQPRADRQDTRDEILNPRTMAIKTMEFLSESELSDLKLPLGSVIRALQSLFD
jgi:hypothetical protein